MFGKYGKEYASLLKLGAPVLLTQLGVITVSFADTMMVGAYSTEALAASAFVNSLYVVPIVMLIGFAGGITPLIGALFTKKDHEGVSHTFHAALQINILLGIFITALLGAMYFYLDFFGQPEEIMPLVRPYYLLVLGTVIPMTIFNSMQQTANGVTDTVSPMIAIIAANALNIIGNYILIFGKFGMPELGLVGAGVSTLSSRIAGLVILAATMRFRKRYRVYLPGLKTRSANASRLRKQIWTTSYPVALQSGIECFLWTFGTIVCGWFGKVELAAYQVVNTLGQLGFMTYMSFATATAIRVSNKMGDNDFSGIRLTAKAGIHLNFILATIASAVFFFLGRPILHLFTPDEGVVASALGLIIPLVLYQYGDAVQYTYASAQRGTAKVLPLAVVAVLAYLLIGTPSLLLLAVGFDLGNVGVFWSFNIALFSAALFLFISFRRTMRRLQTPKI